MGIYFLPSLTNNYQMNLYHNLYTFGKGNSTFLLAFLAVFVMVQYLLVRVGNMCCSVAHYFGFLTRQNIFLLVFKYVE